jgi:hypothetical protein
MDEKELFKRVIHVQEKHITFLDATQRNLSYYLFGKNVDLYKRLTIPRINICNIMNAFTPQPDNPLQSIVGAFIDELAVSEFRTTVRPYPVEGKEPYDSYSDMLEQQLMLIHQKSKRRQLLRSAAFELLSHGYFGLYFDGVRYYFLTAYDLIPGDPNIYGADDQPFIIRKTQVNKATLEAAGVDTKNEQSVYLYEWAQNDDLEMFTLYDVYVKHSDQNIGYTQKGTVVYTQKMSHPKRYPISIANSSEILSSFYTVPVMTQLTQKLIDYQKANASIKESSSSIAKPILTYDSDAGIDVDALHRALKTGYKHIIVGKNAQGDIAFKAPGSLPQYAQQLPDKIEEDIMKHLGLNKTFMGLPNVGARERGALARLLKTSFRKLSSISQVIESAFEEMDQYIIDYMQEHTITYGKQAGINIEQIFSGPIQYIPEERFIAYSTEDSMEKKQFVLNKWKSKLISTKKALEEIGEVSPNKIMEGLKEEQRDQTNFALEMARASQSPPKTTVEKTSNRLKGALDYKFWLTPIAEDKVLVKVHASEVDRVAFILSDMSNLVRIESYVEEIPAPLAQRDPTVPEEEVNVMPEAQPEETNPDTQAVPQPSKEEQAAPEQPKKEEKEDSTSPTVEEEEQPASVEISNDGKFNPKELEEAISKTKIIYDSQKYSKLDGMYIVEPHARWVYLGRKLALVLGREYSEYINKPMLFVGKEVYGVIVLKKIIDDFDFKATQKYHMVTDRERKKWWGDGKVYLYIFEFYPFKFPAKYNKTAGQTTFFGKVDIKEDGTKEPEGVSEDGQKNQDVIDKSKTVNKEIEPSAGDTTREDEAVLKKIKNTPASEKGKSTVAVSPLGN